MSGVFPNERHRNSRNSGAALISVVLILGLLSLFILTIALYVNQRSSILSLKRNDIYARTLLHSALNYGVGRILSTAPGRPAIGTDRIRLNTGRATISWASESGRLDLNAAPPDRLSALFLAAGLTQEDSTRLANMVVMRRSLMPQMPIPNEFRELSGKAVGPFNFVDEIKALPGMTPDLYKFISPLVTVYGRSDRFDSRVSPKALLDIFFASMPEDIDRIEAARGLADDEFKTLLSSIPNAATFIDVKRSPATRLMIDLETITGRKHNYEIVIITFTDDQSPFRILEWREE